MPTKEELEKVQKKADENYQNFILAAQSLRDEQLKTAKLQRQLTRLNDIELHIQRLEDKIESMEKSFENAIIEKIARNTRITGGI